MLVSGFMTVKAVGKFLNLSRVIVAFIAPLLLSLVRLFKRVIHAVNFHLLHYGNSRKVALGYFEIRHGL